MLISVLCIIYYVMQYFVQHLNIYDITAIFVNYGYFCGLLIPKLDHGVQTTPSTTTEEPTDAPLTSERKPGKCNLILTWVDLFLLVVDETRKREVEEGRLRRQQRGSAWDKCQPALAIYIAIAVATATVWCSVPQLFEKVIACTITPHFGRD